MTADTGAATAGRPAVFMDRDGTVVEDPGFLNDATLVRLFPGAARAVRRLGEAGYAVVIVTNQSGIARGLISWDQYEAVTRRVGELLAEDDAHVVATYVCPHYPPLTGACECRKPGLALYRQAAAEHHLDLTRSVWVGDRMTDVEPAKAFGGQAILVLTGEGARIDDDPISLGIEVASGLSSAAEVILARSSET